MAGVGSGALPLSACFCVSVLTSMKPPQHTGKPGGGGSAVTGKGKVRGGLLAPSFLPLFHPPPCHLPSSMTSFYQMGTGHTLGASNLGKSHICLSHGDKYSDQSCDLRGNETLACCPQKL